MINITECNLLGQPISPMTTHTLREAEKIVEKAEKTGWKLHLKVQTLSTLINTELKSIILIEKVVVC